MVHITRGLLDVLLDMAEESEPERMSVVLTATPAGDFERDVGLDPETPVLTTFYLPDAGSSVNAVFGLDLGTPAGRGRARFVSHPQGPPRPTREDDFAAAVIVAVPPWEDESVKAFDRSGRGFGLDVVDAHPPNESLASE
ncbi:hypothetical protein [Halopelagius fulvigenes]|uniref:Proteasome lid subunit RPN8/RPN11, contains Jab1/MPN metalloenzyme (JAMM) motif n=1 Tax=Halopelagius fulvigenes TaxID=1198324 RepID=A0ABD5TY84_9EURY